MNNEVNKKRVHYYILLLVIFYLERLNVTGDFIVDWRFRVTATQEVTQIQDGRWRWWSKVIRFSLVYPRRGGR